MTFNKKTILAILIIFALVLLSACSSGGSSPNQTEAETEASKTISALNAGGVDSLDQHLTEDFTFESSESTSTSETGKEALKEKYFNSTGSNLDFELAEDGTVDPISNSKEIKIHTHLIITIKFDQNDQSYSMPVTLTLKKVGTKWKITNWEEGSQEDQDDDDNQEDTDDQDDLLTPADKEAAEKALNESLKALENENLDRVAELWTADFEYKNSEFEMTKTTLINKYQELFDGGREHTSITLNHRKYNFDDDEIEIYGLLTFSGIKNTGQEYTGRGYYAKFELEKVAGNWLISSWEENASNFDEYEEEDEDDDQNDYQNQEAEEILENMLKSIESEKPSALENYLAADFSWLQDDETLDKEETIAGFKGIFAEGRYYDDYYITNEQTKYLSETKVEISGLFVISGLNGSNDYFEIIEEDQATFTLEQRNDRWYVVKWENE